MLWWVALHALVVASFVASGLPAAVEVIAAVAALVHAVLRRPPAATTVERYPDGMWALPEHGLLRLTLLHATVGPFSILLRFAVRRPLGSEPGRRGLQRCRQFREYETLGESARDGQGGQSAQGAQGAPARPLSVLLLRDQLDDAAWRALQAELRRARPCAEI